MWKICLALMLTLSLVEAKAEIKYTFDTEFDIKSNVIELNMRMEYLEKFVNTMSVSMETIKRSVEMIEALFIKELNISKDPPPIDKAEVDCANQCMKDESCTSVFWSNSSDSECKTNSDKHTLIAFNPGEVYYCKDCQTTIPLVFEGEDSGVIRLVNVATNQTAVASSYGTEREPGKAIDGDMKTQYSSKSLLTKEEPWLMVDLGQRHLVAQIRIHVSNKPIHKRRGGYLKVCLVDSFDRNVNPCNLNTEIITISSRLRSVSEVFDANKVIMGRYIVLKKLNTKEILEIAEIDVHAIIPVISYICAKCNSKPNTFCTESKKTPSCKCNEKHQFPKDGDALNGCRDPCQGFNKDNSLCSPIDFMHYNCSCQEGFHAVDGDPCIGCIDPCDGFNQKNSVCLPVNFEKFKCSCKEGFFPVVGDACNGCRNPCDKVKNRNTVCSPIDFENYNCQCKTGYFPIFKNDNCFGCKNPCNAFRGNNSECIPEDSEKYSCACKSGYRPSFGDPCSGCKECHCKKGHNPIHNNDPCRGCLLIDCSSKPGYEMYENFGCLKVHPSSTLKIWQDARNLCMEEGGDLFTPGDSFPILPKELSISGCCHWIGVRREGSGNYKRVVLSNQSSIADNSLLWVSGHPNRGNECVLYRSDSKKLQDYSCTTNHYIICQIL